MSKNNSSKTRTECPITRAEFRQHVKPLAVTLEGQVLGLSGKEFSTGSFGWHEQGKVTIMINGVPVKCQLNFMLTVVGSKGVE